MWRSRFLDSELAVSTLIVLNVLGTLSDGISYWKATHLGAWQKMTMITLSEKSAFGEGWRRENGSNWIAVYPSGLLPFPLGALKSLSFLFDLKFDREIARMQHSLSALQKSSTEILPSFESLLFEIVDLYKWPHIYWMGMRWKPRARHESNDNLAWLCVQ